MAQPDVLQVKSFDGTAIACWRQGSGPPLVMVHGTTGAHDSFRLLAARLDDRFTIYAVDRRGRGESGDTQPYAFEREVEDAASAVEALDEPVNLFGHSFGANIAVEAALVASNLRRLVLYEPGVDVTSSSAAAIDQMEEMIARGDREGALEFVMSRVVELRPKELDQLRRSPVWASRVAAVHTVPRELRAEIELSLEADRFAGLQVPTLLLLGSESPEWAHLATQALAAALPDARVVLLEGQGHAATVTAPDLLASEIAGFLGEEG